MKLAMSRVRFCTLVVQYSVVQCLCSVQGWDKVTPSPIQYLEYNLDPIPGPGQLFPLSQNLGAMVCLCFLVLLPVLVPCRCQLSPFCALYNGG